VPVETDAHGRLYLSAEQRRKYGERFHVVEYDDRMELIPIENDPLRAAREAAGGAFTGKSAEELREEALDRGRKEARGDLELMGQGEESVTE